MLSKHHVVVCDGYGSISSGRFIFLAVISSHDPSHVAHRLEFYFHGSMVRESWADPLTDRKYESCPHVPDFAETGEIRGEGAEGQYLPSPACREPSCSDSGRGAHSRAGTAQIVGAAGGARYWLAVRRPKHAIGPLLTSSNRTGAAWMNQGGACTGVAVDEVADEHVVKENTSPPRGGCRQRRAPWTLRGSRSLHHTVLGYNCVKESRGNASASMSRWAVADGACFIRTE